MKKSLLAMAVLLGLPVLSNAAVPANAPAATSLQSLDARIRALETEAQKLREQAAQALAEASAAREELEKMKSSQAAAPESAAGVAFHPRKVPIASSSEELVLLLVAPL
jgi:outer membrane murein-binding lipoprotein Lpp